MAYPQNYDLPQDFFNQQPMDMPQQQHMPRYDPNFDQIESYGSIIKDLTDTEKLLKCYELNLIGKKFDDNGNIVTDPDIEPRIKEPRIAREFVDMIRSIANQNTHFSGFDKNDVLNSLRALNYTMNLWMMFQSDNIPLRYRQKLSFEAMNIAKASLMKARESLILQWSKGNIKEGSQVRYGEESKPGFLDFFFNRRKRGGY